MERFDEHEPRKTKIFRGNHKPNIDIILRKASMKRSQLYIKLNQIKDPKDVLKLN